MEVATKPPRFNIGFSAVSAVALAIACAATWLAIDRSRLQELSSDEARELQQARERLTSAQAIIQAQTTALAERDRVLADRSAALAAASMPELPVQVSFRPALLGAGMVAIIRNTSSRTLSVAANFIDPSLGRSKSFALAINPGGVAEIGHAEGWPVTSGQTLSVSANGFKPTSIVAP